MFTTNVYNHTPLHVPIGCEWAYMANQYWGQFLTIIGDVDDDLKYGINGDGEISIADANGVIEIVIMGGNSGHTRLPAYEGEVVGDVNGDGEITIADVNAIIEIILSH